MKAKARHKLKENEVVHALNVVRDFVAPRGKQISSVVVAIVVIAVLGLGVQLYRGRTDARAQQMLGEAMVALNARVVPANAPAGEAGEAPAAAMLEAQGSFATEEAKLKAALPKLKATADAYPDKTEGIIARYHMAGALASLGQNNEAIQAYDEVVRRAGPDTIYGRMARLGKADTQAKAGQVEAAIGTWKELASTSGNDDPLPKDAILMELGRAYASKGDQAEAKKAFTQVIDEHPDSPYMQEARAELGLSN